ncbi:hypothetical protein FJT64_012660 [Amphibalanus amphitrite]|uniref:Uncharacterized protein n=1 Tax=Amphibalanus amphitrite TaxID=1232801 RepID=A0A6A4VEZ6_AMPAM|nr:hypothetical protein FJT64_012660 [Amphibalanus amphitrite]
MTPNSLRRVEQQLRQRNCRQFRKIYRLVIHKRLDREVSRRDRGLHRKENKLLDRGLYRMLCLKYQSRTVYETGGDGPPLDDDFSINEPQPVYKAQTADSNFFAYFLTAVVLCIVLYLAFHNKQKVRHRRCV